MNMILSQREIETKRQESKSEMEAPARKEIAVQEDLSAQERMSPAPRQSVWRRLRAIARNAFREAVRDRVLYNLVFFVLLLIAGAIFLGELSDAQESKIIIDLGLSAMLLFGAFISIFVGVGLVYKEIERRTIYAIFAKPVGRGEFLVGKYLGLCLTLLVNVVVMGIGLTIALLYVRRGWETPVLNIWPAIFLIYVELMILTAVAILFSTFSSPVLSALLTFFIFIIGHFSVDLKTFAASMGTVSARYVFGALFYLLPNLSNYSYITPAAHGQTPLPSLVLTSLAYAVAYITVLLAAATLIFNRRNFK
jgi:ABC-type transport system involved in multi-copper enzyme maturation permease subunit